MEAGIPVFDNDTHCLRTVTNLKTCFDKKRRNKNIKIEDKTAFIQKLFLPPSAFFLKTGRGESRLRPS